STVLLGLHVEVEADLLVELGLFASQSREAGELLQRRANANGDRAPARHHGATPAPLTQAPFEESRSRPPAAVARPATPPRGVGARRRSASNSGRAGCSR